MILYKDGKFRLQDSRSKFGTLCLAKGMIEILPDTTTGMQIGRTLMIFQTRDKVDKDYNIGSFIEAKGKEGKTQIEKERKEMKEKRIKGYKEMRNAKTLTAQDKIKFLNLYEFDYQAYVDEHMGHRQDQIECQEIDHQILLAVERESKEE